VFVSDANPNGCRVLEAMAEELALIPAPAVVPIVVLVVVAPCKGTLGRFHAAPSTNNNDCCCWFPANNASVNTVHVADLNFMLVYGPAKERREIISYYSIDFGRRVVGNCDGCGRSSFVLLNYNLLLE